MQNTSKDQSLLDEQNAKVLYKHTDLMCGLSVTLSPSYIPSYVHVLPANRLICKGHLSHPCDFITEFQGRKDPVVKIGMHIFSACTQYGHKHINFSRVTYERLAHVHFPCTCCKIAPFTCRVSHAVKIHSSVSFIHINPLWDL